MTAQSAWMRFDFIEVSRLVEYCEQLRRVRWRLCHEIIRNHKKAVVSVGLNDKIGQHEQVIAAAEKKWPSL